MSPSVPYHARSPRDPRLPRQSSHGASSVTSARMRGRPPGLALTPFLNMPACRVPGLGPGFMWISFHIVRQVGNFSMACTPWLTERKQNASPQGPMRQTAAAVRDMHAKSMA
jgi:hypothetical protein